MAARAAGARRGHSPRLGGAAPRHARRVSGPARPRAVAPAVALPAPARRQRTGAFERLRALPDHRVVDRLLRSRACIWLIGLMLGGIVAMQVDLLKLNSGISRAVETTGTLQRQNAALEAEIARLSSSERIRAAAVKHGMVDPAAGDTRYLHARPGWDAARAARRMRPPSATAQAVMDNGGRALVTPPSLASPAAATTAATAPQAATGTTATTQPPTTATAAPATSATTPVTAPTATAPTATAPAATAPATPTAATSTPVAPSTASTPATVGG